jgi:hypothetical protein
MIDLVLRLCIHGLTTILVATVLQSDLCSTQLMDSTLVKNAGRAETSIRLGSRG